MDLNKFFYGFRFVIYLFEAFFLYSLQHSGLLKFGFLPCVALLIPSLIVFVALFEGEIFGSIFAFLGGLLLDLGFGVPFGIYASLCGILGYILGVLSNYFINVGFFTTWFFSVCVSALILVLRFFTNYAHFGCFSGAFSEIYLPIMAYTFLMAPIIILLNRVIFYYIRDVRGENK